VTVWVARRLAGIYGADTRLRRSTRGPRARVKPA